MKEGSFAKVAKHHPEVLTIGRLALFVLDDGDPVGFCSEPYFRHALGPALEKSVGEDESSRNIAAEYVRSLLPDCRHEGECW